MDEVYLSEESEAVLQTKMLESVLMALVAEMLRHSANPQDCLDSLTKSALEVVQGRVSANDPKVEDYARRKAVALTEKFMDQFQLGNK